MSDPRMIKKKIEEERERKDIRNPERIIQRMVKNKQKEISQKTKMVGFTYDLTVECCGKRHRMKDKLTQTREVFSCKKCGSLLAISFWRTKVPKVILDANVDRQDEGAGQATEEGVSGGKSAEIKGGEESSPRSEDPVKTNEEEGN